MENFWEKYGMLIFSFFFFFLYADYICCFWFGILYERLKNGKKKNKERNLNLKKKNSVEFFI